MGNKVHQLVSISCGEAFATEFQAYVKHFAALNWNTIYSKPEIVKDLSPLQSQACYRLYSN